MRRRGPRVIPQPLSPVRNHEQSAFEIAYLLCLTSCPAWLDKEHDIRKHDPALYDKLDCMLLLAAFFLNNKTGLPEAFEYAELITADRQYRKKRGLENYCPRSLKFLQEIAIGNTLHLVVQRVLQSSPLFPELIEMVADALFDLWELEDSSSRTFLRSIFAKV